MRVFILGAVLLFATMPAAAQTRWTMSVGPEWTPYGGSQFIGGRVRADYDLFTPTKPLRMRLELGGFWEPTHDYYGSYYLLGGAVSGSKQTMDITFGLSAAVSPFPRARFAPYVAVGVSARQLWGHVTNYVWPAGGGSPTITYASGTSGELVFPVGLGLRARIAGRMFQVEIRRFQGQRTRGLMMGTSLPF